ncbi:MAG: hypothetical protein Q7T33_10140 [Dehalococcoidia bacterium]|nr:hypothetical protein [Dehalococcoidia bacterium]
MVNVVVPFGARIVPMILGISGAVVVVRLSGGISMPQVSRPPVSAVVTPVILMLLTELVFVTVTMSEQKSPGNSPSGQCAPPVNIRVLGPEPKTLILMDPDFRTPESEENVVNTANVPEPRRVAAAPIMRRLRSMLRFI